MDAAPPRSLSLSWAPLVIVLGFLAMPAWAQENTNPLTYSKDAADAEACRAHLDVIFDALQKYREQHQQWPASLSDLTPEFLADRRVLICPFVARNADWQSWRDKVMGGVFSDRLTSYAYEFCQVPISSELWRGILKTSRDYKEQQMAKLGPERGQRVPVVRCLAHRPVLNLAVNGRIDVSGLYWEDKVAPELHEQLEPASVLAGTTTAPLRPAIPPRDPRASPLMLDLTDFYNGGLTNGWQGFPGNDLAALSGGVRDFNGVPFDIRGVVQLGTRRLTRQFPKAVGDIPVNQRCRAIHFLHATGFIPSHMTNVASYVVAYADGQSQEISLLYGRDILDWWYTPTSTYQPAGARIAWKGTNAAANSYGCLIRLYDMKWENPRPAQTISRLNFLSTPTAAAPFLIAITLDP